MDLFTQLLVLVLAVSAAVAIWWVTSRSRHPHRSSHRGTPKHEALRQIVLDTVGSRQVIFFHPDEVVLASEYETLIESLGRISDGEVVWDHVQCMDNGSVKRIEVGFRGSRHHFQLTGAHAGEDLAGLVRFLNRVLTERAVQSQWHRVSDWRWAGEVGVYFATPAIYKRVRTARKVLYMDGRR